MIKEKFKYWPQISLSIGRLASHLPFSCNVYSWAALPAGALGWLAVVCGQPGWGVLLFLLAALFDMVDGGLARYTGQASARGAFLDGTIDRFVDFFIVFSYFWVPLTTPWFSPDKWIFIAAFGVILPSFIVAYANHRQAVHDPYEQVVWRIMNRGEIFTGLLLILIVSCFSAWLAGALLLLLCLLTWMTIIQCFALALIRARH